ncbi:MAG: hypothetical protein LBT89_08770, partial [Planctomycetaceae bacterium]|nr:hypothetical protein [Planctomycetaceae bacterium]
AVSAPDGKFVITTLSPGDGVYAGDYKVTLTKFASSMPQERWDEYYRITLEEPRFEVKPVLPEKYQTAAASPLEFTVKKGKNELRIDVPEELIEAEFSPSLSYEVQMERWKKRNNK